MRTRGLAGSLLTILSLALAQSAYSDFTIGTIDVDFNGTFASPVNTTGIAVIGSAVDVWNSFDNAPLGAQPLNFTTGTASGVSLQLSGSFATGTSVGANGPNAGLTQDFLAVTGGNTGTVTLTGLASNQQYALYLYNGSTSIGRVTTFNVTGATPANGLITNATVISTANWVPAVNYFQLNATSSVSGQLVIQFMNQAASEANFAGFQIRAIPEPSTYALLITGAAVLLLIVGYRARRRASAK
jgi:hypothetical protein